jgi:hypothetical protein
MKYISLAIFALISVACSSNVENVDLLGGQIINLDSVNSIPIFPRRSPNELF